MFVARSQSGLLTTVAFQLGKQAPVYALEGPCYNLASSRMVAESILVSFERRIICASISPESGIEQDILYPI